LFGVVRRDASSACISETRHDFTRVF